MIYSPLSTFTRSRELPLLSSATLVTDGQAMIRGLSGSTWGALPSAGGANEQFLGFLVGQTSAVPFLQTTAVKVETFTVPVGKTLTLSKTLVASSVFVWSNTSNAAVTPDSATGTTVDLTTNGTAGHSVTVTYRYNLSVAEARARNGDVIPGGYAGLTTGTVAIAQAGTIYTDAFNSSLNWTAATSVVYLAANGLLAISGNVAIPATVISIPTVDVPFLGLEFDAY